MAKKKLSSTKGCELPPITKFSQKTDGRFRSGKRHPKWLGSSVPELLGQRFGHLEIVSATVKRIKGYRYVEVYCHSSKLTAWRSLGSIRAGKTTSLHANGKIPIPHAGVLGRRYDAAFARCTEPLHRQYKDYGGRGIEMRFVSRMAYIQYVLEHLPAHSYAGREIDRMNNDGHYEPGNLRLATRKEQIDNRRNTLMLSWRGEMIIASNWASPYSIGTTSAYVRGGMTGEQIIEKARGAVAKKRKNWAQIAARLVSMTS